MPVVGHDGRRRPRQLDGDVLNDGGHFVHVGVIILLLLFIIVVFLVVNIIALVVVVVGGLIVVVVVDVVLLGDQTYMTSTKFSEFLTPLVLIYPEDSFNLPFFN